MVSADGGGGVVSGSGVVAGVSGVVTGGRVSVVPLPPAQAAKHSKSDSAITKEKSRFMANSLHFIDIIIL